MIKEYLYLIKCKMKSVYRKYFTIENPDTYILSDKLFIKQLYKKRMGVNINLKTPKSFTEKLNWIKLYDRNPIYTMMVDKFAVREYIEKKIGGEYLVPLINVWENAKDIEFDNLPDKFVLKCNHNSDVIICTDKSAINEKTIITKLEKQLNEDYYLKKREWPYKNIKKKIICEKYMENNDGKEPIEYKIFCFNGIPKLIMVISERFGHSGIKSDFYDIEWNHLDIVDSGDPCAGDIFDKPKCFDEIILISKKLSENIPFVRVDFNYWNEKIYFGELTFFHAAGLGSLCPEKWNEIMGSWIELPKKRRK